MTWIWGTWKRSFSRSQSFGKSKFRDRDVNAQQIHAHNLYQCRPNNKWKLLLQHQPIINYLRPIYNANNPANRHGSTLSSITRARCPHPDSHFFIFIFIFDENNPGTCHRSTLSPLPNLHLIPVLVSQQTFLRRGG